MESEPRRDAENARISSEAATQHGDADEPPPFLERWSRVYMVVLCYLAVLIVALYVVSRLFDYGDVL